MEKIQEIKKPKFKIKREIIYMDHCLDKNRFWINNDDFEDWFKKEIDPLNKKINELKTNQPV